MPLTVPMRALLGGGSALLENRPSRVCGAERDCEREDREA